VEEARKLLAEGVDPDQRSKAGDTALHEAVRGGHCRLAALLLAHGADPWLTNAAGAAALSTDFAELPTLHRIRQEYQRLPRPPYDADPAGDGVRSTLARLRRDGLVRVSGLLEPGELRRLQRDFRSCVRRLRLAQLFRRGIRQHYDQAEYWYPARRSFVTNDAFKHSPTLLRISCDSRFAELAGHYLEKPFHLKRAYGMRYLPSEPMDAEQFHWHHDMEDRQLKAMVLLTDVGEADQYMTYVRGSHRAFHPYRCFLENRLDFDYCRTYLEDIEVLKTTGRAGDVFFFDSNGMHSGNRSGGAVRDALFVEFTADRNRGNIWGTALRRSAVPEALRAQGSPLAAFLEVTPKWIRVEGQERRKRPTWAVSLEDPRSWV